MLVALSSGAQTALIAAAAAIATAAVTGVASTYGARVRIQEVRLTYDQKLHEGYLAAARTYTATVYVPLSVALTRLSAAFVSFRDSLDPESRKGDANSEAAFREAIASFLEEIETLTARGADAFLTTQLEEEVISLTTFLRKSLTATEPRMTFVFEYRVPLLGIDSSSTRVTSGRTLIAAKGLRAFSTGWLTARLIGVSATYRVEKLLEAPLWSLEFEKRLVDDLPQIKSLIKEVTLGAHAGPS